MAKSLIRLGSALAALLVITATPAAFADESPGPSKNSKCSGGDVESIGLWFGLAVVGARIASRRNGGSR
jgi:hypothetical protein